MATATAEATTITTIIQILTQFTTVVYCVCVLPDPDGKDDAINLTPPKNLSLTLTLPLPLQFLAALVQLLLVTTNFKSELRHMLCDLTIQRHTVAITYDLSGELIKFPTRHTHTHMYVHRLYSPPHHTKLNRLKRAQKRELRALCFLSHSHSHTYDPGFVRVESTALLLLLSLVPLCDLVVSSAVCFCLSPAVSANSNDNRQLLTADNCDLSYSPIVAIVNSSCFCCWCNQKTCVM